MIGWGKQEVRMERLRCEVRRLRKGRRRMEVVLRHHRDEAYMDRIVSTSRGGERTPPREYANRTPNGA
ncbi:hypothetical protein BHE74_00035362 [Ensete ventricosum]|nr:hypothetical protein BHE74_00035362 [Ensete ventricosum]